MTSVLFLHANAEDYLADSLLHGLRSLLGADVVDVPRRDSLYAVGDRSRVYGRGFTLYGTLPEIDVCVDVIGQVLLGLGLQSGRDGPFERIRWCGPEDGGRGCWG